MNHTQLSSLLTPILEPLDLEVEEITVMPAGKRRLLRVIVDGDGPQGRGLSLDDIAEATRRISAALDDSDLVGSAPYTLEVSSRGISRPLTAPRHWRRNRGRLVTATLTDGSAVTGRVGATDEQVVELDVEGTARPVPYADVATALVQVEFNRPADHENDEEEV